MNKRIPRPSSNRSSWHYLGLAFQLMTYLAMAVFAGYRIDRWLRVFPLLTALLPLLVLAVLFYKLLRETR
jgi:hypothetical protein